MKELQRITIGGGGDLDGEYVLADEAQRLIDTHKRAINVLKAKLRAVRNQRSTTMDMLEDLTKQVDEDEAARKAEPLSPEALAKCFHETYERLAPSFSYETRKESAVPWSDVPDKNKKLMIAVCAEVAAVVSQRATLHKLLPVLLALRNFRTSRNRLSVSSLIDAINECGGLQPYIDEARRG